MKTNYFLTGSWKTEGALGSIKNRKTALKITQNRKTAKDFDQNRKANTKPS